MSDTASNLPKTTARLECESLIWGNLPDKLAEFTLSHFKKEETLIAYCSLSRSLDHQYRREGLNYVHRSSYERVFSFESQNFGICCGAQLLVNFDVSPLHREFTEEYFKIWCSLTDIPHFAIFVKTLFPKGRELSWQWKENFYDIFARNGVLIKEWRNPMYNSHLLCMYEFCNHKKYEPFLADLTPKYMEHRYNK